MASKRFDVIAALQTAVGRQFSVFLTQALGYLRKRKTIKIKIWNRSGYDFTDGQWGGDEVEIEAPVPLTVKSGGEPVEVVAHYKNDLLLSKSTTYKVGVSYDIDSLKYRICIIARLKSVQRLTYNLSPIFEYVVFLDNPGKSCMDNTEKLEDKHFVSKQTNEFSMKGYYSNWEFVTAKCAVSSYDLWYTMNVFVTELKKPDELGDNLPSLKEQLQPNEQQPAGVIPSIWEKVKGRLPGPIRW